MSRRHCHGCSFTVVSRRRGQEYSILVLSRRHCLTPGIMALWFLLSVLYGFVFTLSHFT